MGRRDPEIEATEEMLLEAWQLLMRSPDQERGWLISGQRSWWPQIIRDKVMDYADEDARPRQQLGRREVALRDRVFVDVGCLAEEIAPQIRPLVAVVLTMKTWRDVGGFRWERVWEALGGRESGTTSDGLKVRYQRTLKQLGAIEAARRDRVGDGERL
ncbi:hypothetical protein Saro_0643 [Novosphingobium aromaticivorans DSM 12444]|uniref:Uncharacterized protein n=1 Tax=Novosphingobium aromaticivorans (strain ATCC 700278 / DSM 12444 / CCUG 56034 / CIP 105152 / NBRC 16084 / F199) TaxID=279238 RepID=Q2GAN3_NOVAD|nr:hypothetical protein [Novosphingobium aromaticivorans]ABD25090.1 hypothetical protein Saro_0643 [Novosphingobium aromaticivorans DSM 12444]SCY95967.1 hypothetical protein SAMN05660666_03892 [Novosphingobium aromaticivorans]